MSWSTIKQQVPSPVFHFLFHFVVGRGLVAVAQEACRQGAFFQRDVPLGPELGEGGEGRVDEVGQAELCGEFFLDVDVPDGVEGVVVGEEFDVGGGRQGVVVGAGGPGQGRAGAGFIPPPVDEFHFAAETRSRGLVEQLAGAGMDEHGGGIAAEEAVDFGGLDVGEGLLPVGVELGPGGGIGVEQIEGRMEQEVVAAAEDGQSDLLGPPDVGADHDGAGVPAQGRYWTVPGFR